jgi:hypothetical protein
MRSCRLTGTQKYFLSAGTLPARAISRGLAPARAEKGNASPVIIVPRLWANVAKCPLWVISGHLHRSRPCLLYPQKRTSNDVLPSA